MRAAGVSPANLEGLRQALQGAALLLESLLLGAQRISNCLGKGPVLRSCEFTPAIRRREFVE